jgi:hypothetical protein
LLLVLLASEAGAQTVLNWRQLFPQTSPPAREAQAMTYDSNHGQVVLFGGLASIYIYPNGLLNDTWVWDGSNWTQKFPENSPPARFGQAMVYDSAQGQVVLFGGRGENQGSPFPQRHLDLGWHELDPTSSANQSASALRPRYGV